MNPWIEKLRASTSKPERDEILLRDLRLARKEHDTRTGERAFRDVEDQLLALADLAFGGHEERGS